MDANSTRKASCDEPAPPGTSPPPLPSTTKTLASSKGVENAKKRLRAFSIQKKTTPLSAIVPKPISTGTTTVLIGKLSSVKTTPKVDDDQKKPPKPPKPGSTRKLIQDSYSDQQRRTLSEIEDMKRKMELVDLGIPLGLICPTSTDEKAMPTKAMPPIKSFLDPEQVDELIREAKKAKVEGREFKFNYNKILPDYDNPFQRKKEDEIKRDDFKRDRRRCGSEKRDRKIEKPVSRLYSDYRKDDRDKYKERDNAKDRPRNRKDSESEVDINLKDFLICDSWSTNDNEPSSKEDTKTTSLDKSESKETENTTPSKEKKKVILKFCKNPAEQVKESLTKKVDVMNECLVNSPKNKPPKIEKLKPVIDCFKFEIDPNYEEILDIFDESSGLEKYTHVKTKSSSLYSPKKDVTSYDQASSKDVSMDGMNDDTFLESVINEIRQDDNMCDETSQDKRLVEYDESPDKDEYDSPMVKKRAKERKRYSVTPEMDERMKEESRRRSDSDKKESHKKKIDSNRKELTSTPKRDYSDRREQESQRSDYSDRIEEGSQRSEYSVRKEQSSKRSDYSDRKEQVSRRSDYCDRKEQVSQRSVYSDRKGQISQRSDYSDSMSSRSSYSDGRRSSESGYRTSDSSKGDIKYVDNFRLSIEKELDEALERSMNRFTVESLETWSFVLKICQPLLFRHDKNKCYRETLTVPKLWHTENPKVCTCVKDRAIVYEELEMLKMGLVDRLYGCDQLADTPSVNARAWYPHSGACLAEGRVQPAASEWEADDSQPTARDDRPARPLTPQHDNEIILDQEYQRFMEAVWPDAAEGKPDTSRSTTPVRQVARVKKHERDIETEKETEEKKAKKLKLSSEGWSQESDVEEELEKSSKKKLSKAKKTRKRKGSTSTLSSVTESDGSSRKKRKLMKKKASKEKSKEAKRRRMGKKLLKKLKEKQKQKKRAEKEECEALELEEVKKKELKKAKKKKKKRQQKLKKKSGKRKRKQSTTSTGSFSSSLSETEVKRKSKKRKRAAGKLRKRDKRSNYSSESTSGQELFDVNILNNIKAERVSDDEQLEFSPRSEQPRPREIIDVKELQNDFVGGSAVLVKQEADQERHDQEATETEIVRPEEVKRDEPDIQKKEDVKEIKEDVEEVIRKRDEEEEVGKTKIEEDIFNEEKENENETVSEVKKDESEISDVQEQGDLSSYFAPQEVQAVEMTEISEFKEPQESAALGAPIRVIDESNLSQCSSQESVCSVKESSTYEKDESHLRPSSQNSNYSFVDVMARQSLYQETIETIVDSVAQPYEQEAGNYEMYEQLAMAYQSDVASLVSSSQHGAGGEAPGVAPQRIETVVRARARGEIKCDWRADHPPAAPPASRPSRWGLKPREVNIVLTSGPPAVYRIQSLANRADVPADYDEAYMDMYGASDRLQYGDCFAPEPASVAHEEPAPKQQPPPARSTLDDRIDRVLRESAASELTSAKKQAEEQTELPEKGILVTGAGEAARAGKRVSFADGYTPGQDSDLEDPPVKKKRRLRRTGCAWPCPASHPDHVPLWDALPPPPPPPGDPPPTCRRAHDPGSMLGGFMPPEPPPGLISF